MYRMFALAALSLAVAGPALAEATCSTADAAKFQPKAALEAMLTKDGMTIRKIKAEGGCYEVYALDKDGKKVNEAYNAETLEKVADPEAGEN